MAITIFQESLRPFCKRKQVCATLLFVFHCRCDATLKEEVKNPTESSFCVWGGEGERAGF